MYATHSTLRSALKTSRVHVSYLDNIYPLERWLSRDVLFSFLSSGYQLGFLISAVSVQRLVKRVKNALQSITTEWTSQRVHMHVIKVVALHNYVS